jgi:hypothetical protein
LAAPPSRSAPRRLALPPLSDSYVATSRAFPLQCRCCAHHCQLNLRCHQAPGQHAIYASQSTPASHVRPARAACDRLQSPH